MGWNEKCGKWLRSTKVCRISIYDLMAMYARIQSTTTFILTCNETLNNPHDEGNLTVSGITTLSLGRLRRRLRTIPPNPTNISLTVVEKWCAMKNFPLPLWMSGNAKSTNRSSKLCKDFIKIFELRTCSLLHHLQVFWCVKVGQRSDFVNFPSLCDLFCSSRS